MQDFTFITDNIEAIKEMAMQGDADAQNKIGICYKLGLADYPKDYLEAVKWYTKSAVQGFPKAQSNLAFCYLKGEGVQQDSKVAVEWFMKAADQGNAVAQYQLGWCYSEGDGIKKDPQKAVEYFTKAAHQEHSGAQLDLGYCYEFGKGVRKNIKKAVQWYEKSASQGNSIAQVNLGYCYEIGNGTSQNYEMAVEWYKKAAEQGNVRAMNNMGLLYEKGLGVQKDYNKAFEMYCKSAEGGYLHAIRNVGICYENGMGINRSLQRAESWFTKAIGNGLNIAKKDLKRVQGKREKEEFMKRINFSTRQKVGNNLYARVIPFGYNYIVKRKGLWGIIDKNNTVLLPIEFTRVHWFDGGFAGIQKNGLWGLVNSLGIVTIEPQYDLLQYYSQYGACEVEMDGELFVVSTDNDTILRIKGKRVEHCGEKYVAHSRGEWQLYNKDATTYSKVHSLIYPLGNKFVAIDDDEKTLIKENGEEIKMPKFETGVFFEHITQFRHQNKYGVIDENANIVLQNCYDYIILGSGIIAINEGNESKDNDRYFFAQPQKGKWYFLNYHFQEITPFRYDELKHEYIKDGNAWFAKREGQWYRILPSGETLFAEDDTIFRKKKDSFIYRHRDRDDECGCFEILEDPNYKEEGRKLFVRACDGKTIRRFYLTPYLPMHVPVLKGHWKIGDSFVNIYGQDMPNPHAFKMPKQKKTRYVFRLNSKLMALTDKEMISLFVGLVKPFGFEEKEIISLYTIYETHSKRAVLCDWLLRKYKRNKSIKFEFESLVSMLVGIDTWLKKQKV